MRVRQMLNQTQKEILDNIVSEALCQRELVTTIFADTGEKETRIGLTPNSVVEYVKNGIKEKLGLEVFNDCYVVWKNHINKYLYVYHRGTRYSVEIDSFLS